MADKAAWRLCRQSVNGHWTSVERNQVFISVKNLAEKTHLTEDELRGFLDWLRAAGVVETRGIGRLGTVVTFVGAYRPYTDAPPAEAAPAPRRRVAIGAPRRRPRRWQAEEPPHPAERPARAPIARSCNRSTSQPNVCAEEQQSRRAPVPLIREERKEEDIPLPPTAEVARAREDQPPAGVDKEAAELLAEVQGKLGRLAGAGERESFAAALQRWKASGLSVDRLRADVDRLAADPFALHFTRSVLRVFHVRTALTDTQTVRFRSQAYGICIAAHEARRSPVADLVRAFGSHIATSELQRFSRRVLDGEEHHG